jgi:hypothetical protein
MQPKITSLRVPLMRLTFCKNNLRGLIIYIRVSISKIYAQRCIQAAGGGRLAIALKMHARVLASRRGKVHRDTKPGTDFSKFPARVARRALSDERPNDEPRDVPFKVSGIRLPKKNIDEWTGGGLSLSLSLSLSFFLFFPCASSSSRHRRIRNFYRAKYKIFISCNK